MSCDSSDPARAAVSTAAAPAEHEGNRNPPGLGLWELLREDRATHGGGLDAGFLVLAVHRFGNWRMGVQPRALRLPLSALYKLLEAWTRWSFGVTLPYTVKVGRRVRLWHCGGMVLHAASIGDDVHIRQNTTFGIARRDALGLPAIGDRVDIGCGAVLLGRIHIGDDAVIGANAVVLEDVPAHAIAVGVPARVLKNAG